MQRFLRAFGARFAASLPRAAVLVLLCLGAHPDHAQAAPPPAASPVPVTPADRLHEA